MIQNIPDYSTKKRKFTDEQKQPALYIVHRDNPFVSSHADMLLKTVS